MINIFESYFHFKGSEPNSNEFDLTLMICLLRNLTKVTIKDQLPQTSDMSEGAAVSRIKFYRNKIAHSETGTMSDAKFREIFADVSRVCLKKIAYRQISLIHLNIVGVYKYPATSGVLSALYRSDDLARFNCLIIVFSISCVVTQMFTVRGGLDAANIII